MSEPRDPAAPLGGAEVPLLLLPVRVETRWDGPDLLIRVFPDELQLDRDANRPVGLPVAWVATGWRDGGRVFTVQGAPIDPARLPLVPDADSAAPAWLADLALAEAAGMALRVPDPGGPLERLFVFGLAEDGAAEVAERIAGATLLAPGTPTNTIGGAGAPVAAGGGTERLRAALGLDATAGEADAEDAVARAMNTALWPATWGAFLTDRMGLARESADAVREHFLAHVRAGGPLPAVRVGDQPYGVLPATALDGTPDDGPAGLCDVLRRARAVWLDGAFGLPRPSRGGSLVDVLRVGPASVRYAARQAFGRHYLINLHRYLRTPDPESWMARTEESGIVPLRGLGLDWTPPQARAVFAGEALRLAGPAAVAPGAVAWLRDADIDALRAQAGPPEGPDGVLWALLRHGLLLAYAEAGERLQGRVEREPELVGFHGAATVWERFAAPARVDARPGTLAEVVRGDRGPATTQLREVLAALGTLAEQPAEVLARHGAGSLDLAAHRLDAWLTSIASLRLARLRAARPAGLAVGAYGWLEDVAPRGAAPVSDGWIAAPSIAHATTAAILRGGYRARRMAGGAPGPLAVDLSSPRVRVAEELLAGIRGGTPLGELLGARFEAALHGDALDRLIAPLREYAPLAEGVVADGLELVRRYRENPDAFNWLDARERLEPHVRALDEALDALADVTLAEGVHQLAAGSPARAGAMFDALGRGEQPPPRLSVTRTPRSATRHTVKLMALLGADEHAPAVASPRALAEPRVAAWAHAVLGDLTAGSTTASSLGLAAIDVVAEADRLDAWFGQPVDATLPRALRRALATARPATPADLDPSLAATPPAPEALPRARASAEALAAATTLPELARFGVPDTLGEPTEERLAAALGVARARAAAAAAAETAPDVLRAVFGGPVAVAGELTAGVPWREPDPGVIRDWLHGIGRVRPGAGALSDLVLLGDALGDPGAFALAQLPHADGEPALPEDAAALPGPRWVTLAHLPTGAAAAAGRVAALGADEWVEPVPRAEETAAVAFHVDRPDSQPPQAVLLAVPADPAAPWTAASLDAVLGETLDAAAMRTVPPEALGPLAQFLPAAMLAYNPAGEAISTDVGRLA